MPEFTVGPILIGIVICALVALYGAKRLIHTLRNKEQLDRLADQMIRLSEIEAKAFMNSTDLGDREYMRSMYVSDAEAGARDAHLRRPQFLIPRYTKMTLIGLAGVVVCGMLEWFF